MESLHEIGTRVQAIKEQRTANTFPQKLQIGKKCEVCGVAIELINEQGIISNQKCDCVLKREIQEKIKEFEKLSRYRGDYSRNTFERFISRNIQEEELKNKCIKYCDHFSEFKKSGIGLLFYGPAGSGKTFLADCIANEIKNKSYPVLYFQLDSYIKEIKDGWDEKEEKILNLLKNVGLIVIDDWGILKELKDWRYNKIYNLINTIVLEKVPLIVTTNNKLHEIDLDDNKRISDRLKAICKPEMMNFESRRQGVANKKFDLIMENL